MKYTGFMLLTACGRLGFDARTDANAGSGSAAITVRAYSVWNDTSPITPGGVPLAGATVLAAGDVLHADAAGTVVIPATEPTTVHVIYQNPDMFEYVTTVLDVPPGADVWVGTLARSATQPTMTLVLPDDAMPSYALMMPLDCGDPEQDFMAAAFTFTYYDHCEGQPVRLLARAGSDHLDLGEVTLHNGGTLDVHTHAYGQDLPATVTVTNLPIAATHQATLAYRTPEDSVIVLQPPVDGDMTSAENTFAFVEPPGDVVVIDTVDDAGNELISAEPFAATIPFQAPPIIHAAATNEGITVPETAFATANAMRLLAVYQTPVFLEWTIVGPPRTGDVAFPALPPELSGIRPTDTPTVYSILADLSDFGPADVAHVLALDLNGVLEQTLLAPGHRFSIYGLAQ